MLQALQLPGGKRAAQKDATMRSTPPCGEAATEHASGACKQQLRQAALLCARLMPLLQDVLRQHLLRLTLQGACMLPVHPALSNHSVIMKLCQCVH